MKKLNQILGTLFVLPSLSFALTHANEKHTLTAPQCLLKQLHTEYQTLATEGDISLIQTNEEGVQELIKAKSNHRTACGGFMDVSSAFKTWKTHAATSSPNSFLSRYLPPKETLTRDKADYTIQYTKQVNALLKQLNPQLLWDDLTALTKFDDRFANSKNGVEAAAWFKKQVETFAERYHREDVNVLLLDTTNFKQPSVVVKIGKGTGPGVIIGAHMDTLSSRYSKKPGADDDGSGSVTVLEIARTLLSSGMQFKKPIYLMWYAAEEEGLFGSQEVVSHFQKNQIPVHAVLHFDMTGYAYQNDPTIYLMSDNVNKNLTAYLERLIKTYVDKPTQSTRCGYGCSDHASWTYQGYPAAMPFEASFNHDNPDIHTKRDTMDKLSLSHMTDFLKLGVSFAVELADPE